MFNGIIKNTGKVSKVYKKKNNCYIEIFTKMKFTKTDIGSSVSCSGACLTIEKYNKNFVKFYVSKETLNKTIFKSSKKGDIINLEKPLKYGNHISGHFVQGHVDTTCFVKKINIDKKFAEKNIVEDRSMEIGNRKIENVNNSSYKFSGFRKISDRNFRIFVFTKNVPTFDSI